MSDLLKKLTGKNPKDFEPVAYNLINEPDVALFKELVEKDDYLYDFIKNNVANRLAKVCNKNNYKNLLKLLCAYSPSYEDFIVSKFVEYADDDLTDELLEIFENGSESEKCYCAKYFNYILDPLAVEFLNKYAKSDNYHLSANCISGLAAFNDRTLYNEAIENLKSGDDFETLESVRFLVSYGDKNALPEIIKTIKKSSMAENIASELPYLCDLSELLKTDRAAGLYVLNLIINGLGETVALSQLYDFRIYEILENLLRNYDSMSSVVLLNAKEKFDTLTENDEYLFDESKEVKEDVYAIKDLIKNLPSNVSNLADKELCADSLFVMSAIDFTSDCQKLRGLLQCSNQTVILKCVEKLKQMNILTPEDKNIALNYVTNEHIKNIISAI